ncbi:SMP-30/gluconolactonase/LRE family protein [Nocardia wallacei]|uniref:Gluconolaconase n=1 Tax=Nocardia wallacei TaxID=480035 RepID=A0A7G1KLQ0_9NOCA|nr:SMP-30/gluconolactonase/LRE family protein [Nocardia wallacei]BCK54909.1 gluconolaconase [Nocardia wallacei]
MRSARPVRRVGAALDNCSYLGSPLWHRGRLWVSDFSTGRVLATDGHGAVEVVAEVPGRPGGLGFLPDDRLLIVSMKDRRLLVRDHRGAVTEYADLSAVLPGDANEMVVDARGRAYVGNFGFDPAAGEPIRSSGLVRVDPDGPVTVVAEDLAFPNGMAILSREVLVVAETADDRITAFDIAPNGGLINRRTWAAFGPATQVEWGGGPMPRPAVAPGGLCADADDAVWVADCLHGRAVRVREGGGLVDEIRVDAGVFDCALGGPDGRTLFLCTAPSLFEPDQRPTRDARLLAVPVSWPRQILRAR